MIILQILLIAIILILGYISIGYPIFVILISKIINRPVQKSDDYLPTITFLTAAYNEEELIGRCVHSILNINYPQEKIKIIVGNDGSEDNTAEIVEEIISKYSNVELCNLPRSGKNLVINEIAKRAKSELMFFIDADCRLSPDAVMKIVPNFNDKNVGAVLSYLEMSFEEESVSSGRHSETKYLNYENIVRLSESKIFSNVNSMGPSYCIRTDCFKPNPNSRVCDDLYQIQQIALQRKRIVYQPDAVVYEGRNKAMINEMNRRVRFIAGGLSTMLEVYPLLSPAYGWVSLFYWSHKVIRWFLPFYLIMIFVLSLLLMNQHPVYQILFFLQVFFYFLSIIGIIIDKLRIKIKILYYFEFFLLVNIGFIKGWIRFFQGYQNARWDSKSDILQST